MRLGPEQEQLLVDLVEAERRVPRERRHHFIIAHSVGPPGVQLLHEGWTTPARRVFEGDIDILATAGLLAKPYLQSGTIGIYVTPIGFEYYADLKRRQGEPIERVERSIRTHLDSLGFQQRYGASYRKWSEAERELWVSDSVSSFTTIGHLAREAMQEFASALVGRFRPPDISTDPSKVVARVRAVLGMRRAHLGQAELAFLDSLVAYWGTVSDLVQRQEHGGQREGEQLTWIDARRVVFQVAAVMFEIDSSLT